MGEMRWQRWTNRGLIEWRIVASTDALLSCASEREGIGATSNVDRDICEVEDLCRKALMERDVSAWAFMAGSDGDCILVSGHEVEGL